MSSDEPAAPHKYDGVMVSSTFRDLRGHRETLRDALHAEDLFAVWMESHVPGPGETVISSSLEMVRRSRAFIALISHRCGDIPESAEHNPLGHSITRLEFEEAQRLKLPTLVFVMGEMHPGTKADFEHDATKVVKLEEFRERARSALLCITFDSIEDFALKSAQAVAKLRRCIEAQDRQLGAAPKEGNPRHGETSRSTAHPRMPSPPQFHAEPPYIGSHDFVGRKGELETIDEWADAADPHPVLLFEAIGGAGKSMLTWHWVQSHTDRAESTGAPVRTGGALVEDLVRRAVVRIKGVAAWKRARQHADPARPAGTRSRTDWAGRFWYSFYERGAIMEDFVRRAVAYITDRPVEELLKRRMADLADEFLGHVKARPYLFILDGLERVLVAYHRIDAAQVADDAVESVTDQVSDGDPCSAIRPQDDGFLRALAAPGPSKFLISTRLTPKALLNPSHMPLPGVRRIALEGLRPSDAEALLRSQGITGSSAAIQAYLKTNCDCHPLVTGSLAGLINDYLPARGNFDRWVADVGPSGGARLDLAALDLKQRKNHILLAAIAAAPEPGRQLLSTLALLAEAADYETLEALNPHLPPEPPDVAEATVNLGSGLLGAFVDLDVESIDRGTGLLESIDVGTGLLESTDHGTGLFESTDAGTGLLDLTADLEPPTIQERHRAYEEALNARRASKEYREAAAKLAGTVTDLERRGLLLYDHGRQRYDLHPVVRGVAARGLESTQLELYGQRVVDHFSHRPHRSYEDAETLEDVAAGMQVVRTLMRMGRKQAAADTYMEGLGKALRHNLEAHSEVQSLVRPFFEDSWSTPPADVDERTASSLITDAARALGAQGKADESWAAYSAALLLDVRRENAPDVRVDLTDLALALFARHRLARADRCLSLAADLASIMGGEHALHTARFGQLLRLFGWGGLEAAQQECNVSEQSRTNVWIRLHRGDLQEEHLAEAEALAARTRDRRSIRELHRWRGEWLAGQGRWESATSCLAEAVRMARERGLADRYSESLLALARFRTGAIDAEEARHEAARLESGGSHRWLVELWLALGERELAEHQALQYHRWAWGDGEPYVSRIHLKRAVELLTQLGVAVPELPSYDPTKDSPFEWEAELRAFIERLARVQVDSRASPNPSPS
ncbi:MAG: DUF4062 domain-containing protein [Phycisphaerales bacterium]